jgi:hypothetical protein
MKLEDQYPEAAAKYNTLLDRDFSESRWNFDGFAEFVDSMVNECGWIEEEYIKSGDSLFVSMKKWGKFEPGNIKLVLQKNKKEVVNYAERKAAREAEEERIRNLEIAPVVENPKTKRKKPKTAKPGSFRHLRKLEAANGLIQDVTNDLNPDRNGAADREERVKNAF